MCYGNMATAIRTNRQNHVLGIESYIAHPCYNIAGFIFICDWRSLLNKATIQYKVKLCEAKRCRLMQHALSCHLFITSFYERVYIILDNFFHCLWLIYNKEMMIKTKVNSKDKIR